MTPSDGKKYGDIVEVRSSKQMKKKTFGSDFFVYFIQGTRDSIKNEIPYVYIIDSDSKEAMNSHNAPFWKEVV